MLIKIVSPYWPCSLILSHLPPNPTPSLSPNPTPTPTPSPNPYPLGLSHPNSSTNLKSHTRPSLLRLSQLTISSLTLTLKPTNYEIVSPYSHHTPTPNPTPFTNPNPEPYSLALSHPNPSTNHNPFPHPCLLRLSHAIRHAC